MSAVIAEPRHRSARRRPYSGSRDELLALLDTDADAAVGVVRDTVTRSMQGTSGVVLAGAGSAGQWVASRLRETELEVRCFTDNAPRLAGAEVAGLPVLSPAEAVRRHHDAAFVVATSDRSSLHRQLVGLGARSVIPYTWLGWHRADDFLPYYSFDLPHSLLAARAEVVRLYDLLGDERSRQTLVEQVRWRLTLDDGAQGAHADIRGIYAEPGVCVPTPADVYVDIGAFDGDSIALHLGRTGGDARAIIAIEADPKNEPALRAGIAALPNGMAARVETHHVAVGAQRGRAMFQATGTLSSAMSAVMPKGAATPASDPAAGGDTVPVDVVTLDDLLAGRGATYVKMDIEGAEPLALAGAKRLLAAGDAVWATCLYHAAEHLWQIPLQIADSGGAYRHAIRRYAHDCWEMVHYAVPAGRS